MEKYRLQFTITNEMLSYMSSVSEKIGRRISQELPASCCRAAACKDDDSGKTEQPKSEIYQNIGACLFPKNKVYYKLADIAWSRLRRCD